MSANLSLTASDLTGSKTVAVEDVPADATVQEIVDELLAELNLPVADTDGRPLSYQARLDREGRHLNANESVGDCLKPGDHLELHPNIDAGGLSRGGP